MQTISELEAALDAIRAALMARGYEETHVKAEVGVHDKGGARWQAYAVDIAGTNAKMIGGTICWGPSLSAALGELRAIVAEIPPKWSAADVAATIGLPMCAWCDEAVATHDSHDDHYAPLGSRPERVCEPCLERAADRQVERAMEG